MSFKMGKFYIEGIEFGEETKISGRKLMVNSEELSVHLKQFDARIKDLKLHIVKPGDSTRIICVKDAVEPRIKIVSEQPWESKVHTLKNMAVVTCGQIVAPQEGIIDMRGPGAPYSPFSEIFNLVLEIYVDKGLEKHQHEETLRMAGLEAANYLAAASIGLEPDQLTTYDLDKSVDQRLDRIAYVYMLLSQGLLHDTYVDMVNAKQGLPKIVQPQFVLENGIHSGNCVSACDKNTTWHHQNNPVIYELLNRHGQSLNFVGLVLTNEPTKLTDKQISAARAIELTKRLNADGVIITEEGFGNPEADLMMIVRGLEQSEIQTVSITDEYAGSDGDSQSLADTTIEANAIISTGNANQLIDLPPMDQVIGPIKDLTKLAGAYPQSLNPDGSLTIEIQGIIGATNELGERQLSCREV